MRTSTKKLPSPGRGRLTTTSQSFSVQHVLAKKQVLQDDPSQLHQAGELQQVFTKEDAANDDSINDYSRLTIVYIVTLAL